MRRTTNAAQGIMAVCVMAAIFGCLNVRGILPSDKAALPNYDKRADAGDRAPAVPDLVHRASAAQLQARLPAVKVDRDPLLGTPHWIMASDGFLTGPDGEGRGVTAGGAGAFAPDDPHRAIKGFLNEHSALFGHNAGELSNARV